MSAPWNGPQAHDDLTDKEKKMRATLDESDTPMWDRENCIYCCLGCKFCTLGCGLPEAPEGCECHCDDPAYYS